MSPESWTIIATGVVLAALIVASSRALKADLKTDIAKLGERMGRIEDGMNELRERVARLEGKMALMLQGLQIRIEPKNTRGAD